MENLRWTELTERTWGDVTEATAPSFRTITLHRVGAVVSLLGPIGVALSFGAVIPVWPRHESASLFAPLALCVLVAVPAGLTGVRGLERSWRLLGYLGAVTGALQITAILRMFAIIYPSDLGWDGPVPFLVVVWVAVGLTWAPFVFRAVRLERIAIVTAWCSTAWLILNALSSM